MDEVKQLNAVIDVIMLAGTILLRNGSEIYRVEDTMIRIAHSQGIMDCNVLAMPAAIFFSIENTNISRMKRVTSSAYNIEKVCDVNQISRQLVAGQLDLETAFIQLKELNAKASPYTNVQLTAAATLSAPFFSIMFGGNVYDAIGAGVATLFAFTFSLYVEGALVFGLIAQFWARYSGLPSTADLVIAGAVMPFVPGIALTNAVRDIMTNHINSGMSKMFESLLITLALGAGTSVALVLMN